MFGLDHWLAGLSDGTALLAVIGVAIVLGLRHASDPDHLAAVTTLIASGRVQTRRAAAALGLAWGAGHAVSLFAFGLPIVLFKAYLPERVQMAAEATVGLVIMALAAWLLVRWRRGFFHLHLHEHDRGNHVHGHSHERGRGGRHAHAGRARSPWQAFGVGLVHGIGGTAGVGILLLATIHNRLVAVAALALFATFTAVSMALLSTGFGTALSSRPARRAITTLAPAFGVASLAFGVWYSLGALNLAPYFF
jgi:ABC-type nickel/cobalt efflux system permease component RcnA